MPDEFWRKLCLCLSATLILGVVFIRRDEERKLQQLMRDAWAFFAGTEERTHKAHVAYAQTVSRGLLTILISTYGARVYSRNFIAGSVRVSSIICVCLEITRVLTGSFHEVARETHLSDAMTLLSVLLWCFLSLSYAGIVVYLAESADGFSATWAAWVLATVSTVVFVRSGMSGLPAYWILGLFHDAIVFAIARPLLARVVASDKSIWLLGPIVAVPLILLFVAALCGAVLYAVQCINPDIPQYWINVHKTGSFSWSEYSRSIQHIYGPTCDGLYRNLGTALMNALSGRLEGSVLAVFLFELLIASLLVNMMLWDGLSRLLEKAERVGIESKHVIVVALGLTALAYTPDTVALVKKWVGVPSAEAEVQQSDANRTWQR